MQLKAENRNLQQQAEKITTELKTVQAAYINLLQTNEELKKAHELLQTETQHKLSVSSDKLSEKTDEAKNLITSFTESKNALASTQARISYTEKNITSISEIATMIEDIAEQIKMLSMNAAIEAAHAGESGKGFAVVATEMSKLATATSENSKNISTTVKELIKDITFIARAGGDLEKAFEKLDATTNSVHRFLVDVKKELI
jgi:methyl-accepting chemotaxis domain protein